MSVTNFQATRGQIACGSLLNSVPLSLTYAVARGGTLIQSVAKN